MKELAKALVALSYRIFMLIGLIAVLCLLIKEIFLDLASIF